MPINPLIQSTSSPVAPRGDEVQATLMTSPFQQGTQEAADYESGYKFCEKIGHMQLGGATPDQIEKWRLNPVAWRQGFAAAAKTMGLSIIGDSLLQQKTAADQMKCPVCEAPQEGAIRCKNGHQWCAHKHYWFTCPEHGRQIGSRLDDDGKLKPQKSDTCYCNADGSNKSATDYAAKLVRLRIRRGEISPDTKTADLVAMPHQENVAKKLEDSPGQIAVHGLGSGKTFTAIHSARRLKLPMLAVVPASLRNNMRKELHAANFEYPSKVVSYQEAMNKKDDPAFRDFASKALVTFDEAQRMGQVTSDRSGLAQSLPAKKKLLLSATPIRNSPEEIVPLVNAVSPGTFPDNPEEFKKKYIGTREVPVGFWGRLRGVKPGIENVPINLHHFAKAVKGKVDFYNSVDRTEYPSHDEKIMEVPMSKKQEAAYNFVMGKYPTFSYRIRHGLPLNRRADQDFQAFMIGPRQVSNHPAGFNSSATDHDAPKIMAAVDEIQHRYKKDKNFRGVAYSSFLDAGINPMSRELQRRKIPHQIFTGDINDKERGEIVKNYNHGKSPVLLISGAGAEGLDLKGTKLMQIMEPHWQDTMIDQVKGRSIRYKSHVHLPEHERHVEVQRFHTIPKATLWDRMLGRKRTKDQSVDEYIYDMAKKKSKLNDSFMDAMQGKFPKKTAEEEPVKFSEWYPVDDHRFPGLLVDLDKTLVTQPNGFSKELGLQVVLPNRLEILTEFKNKGYKIVGVTNRSIYKHESQWGPDDLMSLNRETLELFKGLLDDIVCCMFESEHQKPAPTMLQSAMTTHGLDPENTIFVGDDPVDKQAADAAGLPFYWAEEFFSNPVAFSNLPPAIPSKVADWTDERNRDVHVLKHGPEFGGPEQYLALEQEMSTNPPHDLQPINQRCSTKILPNGQKSTRCATGYYSPTRGLLHVKDDHTANTVTLYKKVVQRGP